MKGPSTSLRVASAITVEPGFAGDCIRDARFAVWPIDVYSTRPLPVAIDRTTSPLFAPTRICRGARPSERRRSA